jgi:hypoxanthine phosphoribosyltransferase
VELKNITQFIKADEIDRLNQKLADQINQDYSKALEKGDELMVIITLKGAMFFAADLLKKVTVPVKIDFVRLTSYGSGTKSTGTVRILKDIETSPEGKHLLVVDEIVDSGRTLSFLFDRLKAQKPKSIKLCALLSKPSRREIDVKVDYLGRDVEDKFLVGYGLDCNEQYRNLRDIYFVPT